MKYGATPAILASFEQPLPILFLIKFRVITLWAWRQYITVVIQYNNLPTLFTHIDSFAWLFSGSRHYKVYLLIKQNFCSKQRCIHYSNRGGVSKRDTPSLLFSTPYCFSAWASCAVTRSRRVAGAITSTSAPYLSMSITNS